LCKFAGLVLSFIACFILLVIAPLAKMEERSKRVQQSQETLGRRVLYGGSTTRVCVVDFSSHARRSSVNFGGEQDIFARILCMQN